MTSEVTYLCYCDACGFRFIPRNVKTGAESVVCPCCELKKAQRQIEVLREMLKVHREFFSERQCRWMPYIGIKGAVRVGVNDAPCMDCDFVHKLTGQIDHVLKGK